jgi:hypothetical protein
MVGRYLRQRPAHQLGRLLTLKSFDPDLLPALPPLGGGDFLGVALQRIGQRMLAQRSGFACQASLSLHAPLSSAGLGAEGLGYLRAVPPHLDAVRHHALGADALFDVHPPPVLVGEWWGTENYL